jgi:hypothetical protein
VGVQENDSDDLGDEFELFEEEESGEEDGVEEEVPDVTNEDISQVPKEEQIEAVKCMGQVRNETPILGSMPLLSSEDIENKSVAPVLPDLFSPSEDNREESKEEVKIHSLKRPASMMTDS